MVPLARQRVPGLQVTGDVIFDLDVVDDPRPEHAIDCACGLYLNDPAAWS